MPPRLLALFGFALALAPVQAQSPNFRVAIARELANLAAEQKVDRCDKLDEIILGARVRGLGRSVGTVQVEFQPCDTGFALDLVLNAVNTDLVNTIGTKGPVSVLTQGNVYLSARKRIFITPHGITSTPATADAHPTADLGRIDTQFHGTLDKLVRRIATKVYQKDQGEALAIGRAIGIARLQKTFDEDVAPRLEKANAQLADLRTQAQERKLWPQTLQFSSDPAYLHVVGASSTPPDPATLQPPPEVPFGTHAAGWLHESLPNGLLTRTFAGKKLTSAELAKELGTLLGRPLPTPGAEDPFTIHFADVQPVTLAFREGRVALTIRSKGFTTELDAPPDERSKMDTTVNYKLTLVGTRLVGERDDIDVWPPDISREKNLGVIRGGIRSQMLAALEPRFPKRFEAQASFPTPATFAKAGNLLVERIVSERGWLAASLRWTPPLE